MTPPLAALEATETETYLPLSSVIEAEPRGHEAPAHRRIDATQPRSSDPAADPLVVEDPWALGYDWPVVIWIAVVHLGALAAPFVFTWKALGLCAFLCWFTGSIGVCMGYHRHLTHGSFATYRPVRWLLALIGGLSGEGSALTWVANHRKHHLYSDHEGDPHSPQPGALVEPHVLVHARLWPQALRNAHRALCP